MLLTLWGTLARRRGMVLALSLIAFAIAWIIFDADRLRAYAGRDALIAAQKQRGYLLVGTIGRTSWPAFIVTLERGVGGVEFVSAAGQPHRYQGFTGPMKALHLRSGFAAGSGFTMVFHRPVPQSSLSPVAVR